MRNKEVINHQCYWHNIGFGTQECKQGESVVPWDPSMTLEKEEAANSEKHLATVNQSKILEKTLLELKESKKREGNTTRYP